MASDFQWVQDAIKDAHARGAIPFVAVVPVTSELLREAAGSVDQIVGDAAGEEIAKSVREWQQENCT